MGKAKKEEMKVVHINTIYFVNCYDNESIHSALDYRTANEAAITLVVA